MVSLNEYQADVIREFLEDNWCEFITTCCDRSESDNLEENGHQLANDIAELLGGNN